MNIWSWKKCTLVSLFVGAIASAATVGFWYAWSLYAPAHEITSVMLTLKTTIALPILLPAWTTAALVFPVVAVLTAIYGRSKGKADLFIGLLSGLAIGLIFGLYYGVAVGLTYAVVVGLIYGVYNELIYRKESRAIEMLTVGFVYSLVVGLKYGLIVGLASSFIYLAAIGIIYEICLCSMAILIWSVKLTAKQ